MSARWAAAVFGLAFGVAGLATGLSAQQMLHEEARVGKNSCMVDHYHFGSSKGQPSKKAAEAEAVISWASFVDFEYGSAYASWKIAAGKQVDCAKESGGTWGCSLSARPCRRLRK